MPFKRPAHHQAAKPADQVALAACSIALTTGNELQLLPAGEFRGVDGRPLDAPHWYVNAALAQVLIAAADARKTPYVIDYEHQTLLSRQNGQPAPAAGWFKKLEWREGVGLFATDVTWTPRATAMIEGSEYKFISPVILYSKANGNVTALLMAAATNNPNIDGMEQLLLDAAALHFSLPLPPTSLTQENPMDELLEQLRWLLNLPVGSTAQDIHAQLMKLCDTVKECMPEATAAANFDLTAHLVAQRTAIASLSAATPDPAKFVAIGVMQGLQTQVAQLTADLNTTRLDGLVKVALDAGKLLPSQEAWAREWGGKDFAALSAYIDNAPALALLNGTQTKGVPPNSGDPTALTANQAALCAAMGVSQDAFRKTLQAEQA
jgi:phage I-like protein